MMDTYSMHMRQTVTAVVTGKLINIGDPADAVKPLAAASWSCAMKPVVPSIVSHAGHRAGLRKRGSNAAC
jgi:hypothetical protein